MSIRALEWARTVTTGSPTRKAVLRSLADCHNHHTGLCCPHIETIVDETEFSSRAVEEALKVLVVDKIVTRQRKRRTDGSWAGYVYRFPALDAADANPPAADASSPPAGGAGQEEPEVDLEPGSKTLSPAKPSKEERDTVWNALEAVFGVPTTPQHRKRFGKVQKELLADTSLAPAAAAAEVPLRSARYRAKWPDCELTLEALAKHWPDLRGNGAASFAPAWITLDASGIPVELLSVEDYREWRRTASPMENATYQQRFDVADDGLPA